MDDLGDPVPVPVALADLTNTYFEGEAGGQPKARRGHSKEKRTDCPLLTLGLVLDASGFVRRSTRSTPRAPPWWCPLGLGPRVGAEG